MQTDLQISHLTVNPGVSKRVDISVTNTTEVIDGVTAIVDGINPEWVRLERPLVSVFPDASDQVTLVFDIPTSCPAGDYLVVVHVVSTLDTNRESVQDFWLTVTESIDLGLELTPSIITGGKTAAFSAKVLNTSNTDVGTTINAWEPTRAIDCRVEPQSIVLPYQESAPVEINLRGPRPWFGQPTPYSIIVTAQTGETVTEQTATFNQKPRIPRGVITALILGGIILLWALIFLWVISEVRSGEKVTKAVATDLFTGTDGVPLAAVAGEAGGRVTASTNSQGIESITVEANRIAADGELQPIASVASDADGAYTLPALVPGTYKLRFSADGYADLWYPDAADAADAAEIPIVPAAIATPEQQAIAANLNVQLTGDLGRLVGVIALPPDSPQVPLTVTVTPVDLDEPAAGDAGAGADDGSVQIDTSTGSTDSAPAGDTTSAGDTATATADSPTYTQVTEDGVIDIDGLPTPATYEITITGEGFEAQQLTAELGGGDASVLNTVRMSAATGEISGVTVDQAGSRLGGVTVTASSGDQTFSAVTPTSGDVGTFRFIGLETPQTYVLNFEREGFSSSSQALSLEPGQPRDGLSATLVGGNGTISGVVVDVDGSAVGGAQVDVRGGDVVASTSTLTTGTPGAFFLTSLPVPNRYAVTVTADGYQAETVDATLLVSGEQGVGTITMLSTTAEISGTVSVDGAGRADVIVTLDDGTVPRSTVSATNPAGLYAFSGVPTGSYTLTFEGTDLERRVVLVTVESGVDLERSVSLTEAP